MTQLSNVLMQPNPTDAVERLTLIEKLEQEVKRLIELKAQEKPHSLGYVFLGHHIAATVNAINIVKQHSDWISVDERLPEDDENVLVYSGDKEMFIAWCGVLGRTWRDSFRDAPYDELVGISITHWMPLPPPPSEVQNV